MKQSIQDIAKQAGVSIATVSRVINSKPGVTEKTQNRIKSILDKYNYRPTRIKKGDYLNIGVVIPCHGAASFSDWYTNQLLEGVYSFSFSDFINVVTIPLDDYLSMRIDVKQELVRKHIDGIIVINATRESAYTRELHEDGFPVVLINEDMGGSVHSIFSDSGDGVYRVVRMMLERGHRDIEFFHGHLSFTDTAVRINGFKKAMLEAGVDDWERHLVLNNPYSNMPQVNLGYERAVERIKSGSSFTAVLCNNDDIALGVLKACTEAGLKVPDDVSLCGFDDHHYGRYLTPSLSTIRQSLKEMGKGAVDVLSRIIKENAKSFSPLKQIFPVELIVRDSLGKKK